MPLRFGLDLCAVATIRALIRRVAPHAGRALGRRLHGDAWLVSGHGATVDWRRFADVVHFTLEHLALTGFVLVWLAPEVADWVRAPRLWWALAAAALVQAPRLPVPADRRQP